MIEITKAERDTGISLRSAQVPSQPFGGSGLG